MYVALAAPDITQFPSTRWHWLPPHCMFPTTADRVTHYFATRYSFGGLFFVQDSNLSNKISFLTEPTNFSTESLWMQRQQHREGSTGDRQNNIIKVQRFLERPGRDADPSPPSSAVVMKGQSYTSSAPTGRTACTEPQCLYKGAPYLTSVPVQGCTLPYLSACTRVHFTFFTLQRFLDRKQPTGSEPNNPFQTSRSSKYKVQCGSNMTGTGFFL